MSTGSMVEDIERQQRGDPPASIPENVFEMDPDPIFAKHQIDQIKTAPSPVSRQSLKPTVSPTICLPKSSISDNTRLPGVKSASDALPTGQVAEGLDIKMPSSPFYLKSHLSSDISILDQSVGLLTPAELEQSVPVAADKVRLLSLFVASYTCQH